MMDPTLDRLFRHMAWANANLIARLGVLPDVALAARAPGSDWTVAMTLQHVVDGAGSYAWRLAGDGSPRPANGEPPVGMSQLPALAAACAAHDARLRAAAALPEGVAEWLVEGQARRRARSTLLAQSIHHATEHRAQIAGALAANGWGQADGIDLDDLDLWSYGDAEGLGA